MSTPEPIDPRTLHPSLRKPHQQAGPPPPPVSPHVLDSGKVESSRPPQVVSVPLGEITGGVITPEQIEEKQRLARRGRISVVDRLYCQKPDEGGPFPVEWKFARYFDSGEDVWVRAQKVGPEWVPIDCGWMKEAGVAYLINEEGTSRYTVPSPEKIEAERRKVVEVGLIYPDVEDFVRTFSRVRAGESIRFEPLDLPSYRVRCTEGTVKMMVYLFPL